ncbi:hypothetical protein EVAR_81983_1 [Eumeta japonica]|uniref:Uncharacterized protein n=1 Tax=Eumeta variegata TaxID=151549 RepID=A0A4C1VUX4_EUMVA|nr:hypothetical protein EVAR_81983_1 [Eumeta japonica]
MELEGGHRNSVIKRCNPIEFELVFNDAKEIGLVQHLNISDASYRTGSAAGPISEHSAVSGLLDSGDLKLPNVAKYRMRANFLNLQLMVIN